ncbi:hypothetical protein BD324DRAFT_611874 [Kockovaella imperatae]|uniref:Complex 1 LYR protein n=1 Tax=Kockovaella imperatae TaxID=4999 RepID=A0A1Y1USW9_9TREE|nr:hypothetical protein BD324DRAFT_611874 [Kockovaella imperatae]ORX40727.1 hypothetical protein BD324DRAFT_611874 [Kockovaella imperatae]
MPSRVSSGAKLTLQHFLLQSSLLHAYRGAVRATRPLPDSLTRRETLDFFRGELEQLRFVTDLETLRTSLSAFQRTTKIMGPQLGLGGLSSESGSKLIGRARSI